MRIGPFGLWMLATFLVGGTFVFAQISHVSQESDTYSVMNSTEPVSSTQNKWSVKEFEKNIQNPPFNLILPNNSNLSTNQLTGAYISKVKGSSTNEEQVDLYYKTSNGIVHIWESNRNIQVEHNDEDEMEKTTVGDQKWNYDKVLKTFTTRINGTLVQVSGQVSKEQLLSIITSLNN